ncbi:acyl-CoA thioesterase, partial [Candidatus Hodarchaeum mangrovi]
LIEEWKMNDVLDDYPVITELLVSWGDMDALHHVNHTVYFRYFLDGRVSYLEKINALTSMEETGVGLILASIQCRFKIPLTYPDTLLVGTKAEKLLNDRIFVKQILISTKHKKPAAEADALLVAFDYQNNHKTNLPKELIQKIQDLEGIKSGQRRMVEQNRENIF